MPNRTLTSKVSTSQYRLANQEVRLATIYRKLSCPGNSSLSFRRSRVSPGCIEHKVKKNDQPAKGLTISYL